MNMDPFTLVYIGESETGAVLQPLFPALRWVYIGDDEALARLSLNVLGGVAIVESVLTWRAAASVLHELRSRCADFPVLLLVHPGSEAQAAAWLEAGLADAALIRQGLWQQLLPAMTQQLLRRVAQIRQNLEIHAQYLDIFERIPVGLYRTTPEGEILAANRALLDLLGYPDLASLQAVRAGDIFVDPAERERQRCILDQGGSLRDDEVRWRRRDGSIIWVRDNARAVYDAEGRVRYYEGAALDVTERRHTRLELQRERDFVAAVLNTVGAIIVILDPQGRVMRCNRAFEQLFHYSESEIRGKMWSEVLLAPEEIERVGQIFQRLRAGHLPSAHEYNCLTREGERRLVAWSNSVLRDASGAVTHILITGIDVTERKQAEEELARALERYRSVVQNVQEYIYSVEMVNGQVVSSYHSPRCVEVTGYTPEEYQRDPELWLKMIHPDERRWVGAQFLRVMAGDTNVPSTIEHRIIRRDGSERWIANTFTAQRDGARVRLDGFILDITERRKVDEELERRVAERTAALETINARLEQEMAARQREELLFRSLFEQANDAIFIEDEEDRIIDANPRACELLGYTREELLQMRVSDLQAPEVRGMPGTVIRAELASGRRTIEGLDIRKDGTRVPVEVSTTRLSGLAEGLVLSIVRDISERKQTEEALRRAHEELEERVRARTAELEHAMEQLRTLYHLGQVINAARDMDTILDHLISEALRVTGATHGQVLIVNRLDGVFERRAQRGFSPEELERARLYPLPLDHGVNARALRTRKWVRVDDVTEDPEYFPLIPGTRTEMAIPLIASGTVIGNLDLQSPHVGAFRQVDMEYLLALAAQGALALENANLLETARQARQDWETTFNTLQDALFIVDEAGRIVRANRIWETLQEDERAALLAWAQRPGPIEEKPTLLELETRSFEVQRFPLRTRTICSARDVSERRRMEQALIRAERLTAMGTLAAALAHEINNPLQSIKNSVELVLDFPLREEDRRRYLEVLRQEIERLIKLVQQVLNYTRPTPSTEPQAVDVQEALRYAQALIAKKLEDSAIKVRVDVQGNIPPVLAGHEPLVQVFLNLMMNAMEAMPEGGELHIRIWRRRQMVYVAFRDTGPGLSADVFAHLFDPFFTTKPGGSGLGLPISRNLVEQYNGQLKAENARDERGGAVFTVALPVAT